MDKKRVVRRLVAQFVWGLVAVRFLSSFTLPGYNGLVLSEWLSLKTWVIPAIVSLGVVFGYWRYYKKGEYPFEK